MAVTLRTCVRCGEIKPLETFHRRSDRDHGGGYGQGCKDCYRDVMAELRSIRRGDPVPPESLIDRFERYYQPIPWTGCWIWTGGISSSLHGKEFDCGTLNIKRPDGRWIPTTAYRVAWALFRGEIPIGKLVCHKCDNRLCVNPDHLFIGSHKDNTQDMMKKGRHVKAYHRMAKLKESIQWQ